MSTLRHDLANALAPLSLHDDPEVVACVARAMAIVDAMPEPVCETCGGEPFVTRHNPVLGDVWGTCPACGAEPALSRAAWGDR